MVNTIKFMGTIATEIANRCKCFGSVTWHSAQWGFHDSLVFSSGLCHPVDSFIDACWCYISFFDHDQSGCHEWTDQLIVYYLPATYLPLASPMMEDAENKLWNWFSLEKNPFLKKYLCLAASRISMVRMSWNNGQLTCDAPLKERDWRQDLWNRNSSFHATQLIEQ